MVPAPVVVRVCKNVNKNVLRSTLNIHKSQLFFKTKTQTKCILSLSKATASFLTTLSTALKDNVVDEVQIIT